MCTANVLREEELELLVGELAQLGAEDIVDADVVCIASTQRVGGQSRVPNAEVVGEEQLRRCSGLRWLRESAATHAR